MYLYYSKGTFLLVYTLSVLHCIYNIQCMRCTSVYSMYQCTPSQLDYSITIHLSDIQRYCKVVNRKYIKCKLEVDQNIYQKKNKIKNIYSNFDLMQIDYHTHTHWLPFHGEKRAFIKWFTQAFKSNFCFVFSIK